MANYINYVDYRVIYCTNGRDSIYNLGDHATIFAGAGKDTITNHYYYGDYAYLSGGSGNDVIKAGTDNYKVTISGGKGNDKMTGSTKYVGVFQFGSYDGYDTITNYGSGDTIYLSSAYSVRYGRRGNDRVLYTAGGRITLKNAANKNVTVKFASGGTNTIRSGSSRSYMIASNSTDMQNNEVFYSNGDKSSNKIDSSTSKLWFVEDDNVVSSDNLSSITKNDLASTALEKIEKTNFENLTEENNFVTYSGN